MELNANNFPFFKRTLQYIIVNLNNYSIITFTEIEMPKQACDSINSIYINVSRPYAVYVIIITAYRGGFQVPPKRVQYSTNQIEIHYSAR